MFLFTHGHLSGIRLFQSNWMILSTAVSNPIFFQSFLRPACSYSCPRLCETIAQVSGPAAVTVLSKAAVALLSECCLRGPAAVKPAMIPALGFALRRFPKLYLVAELGFLGYVSNQNRRNLGNTFLSCCSYNVPLPPSFWPIWLEKNLGSPSSIGLKLALDEQEVGRCSRQPISIDGVEAWLGLRIKQHGCQRPAP